MFEISFPELVILAVVALLVLGPERLPRAAQFVGLWVRRARAHWHEVKSQFERELADEELRKSIEATRSAMRDVQQELRDGIAEVDAAARGTGPASGDDSLQVNGPRGDAHADAATEATSSLPKADDTPARDPHA